MRKLYHRNADRIIDMSVDTQLENIHRLVDKRQYIKILWIHKVHRGENHV